MRDRPCWSIPPGALRAALYAMRALGDAVETGLLDANPTDRVAWRPA